MRARLLSDAAPPSLACACAACLSLRAVRGAAGCHSAGRDLGPGQLGTSCMRTRRARSRLPRRRSSGSASQTQRHRHALPASNRIGFVGVWLWQVGCALLTWGLTDVWMAAGVRGRAARQAADTRRGYARLPASARAPRLAPPPWFAMGSHWLCARSSCLCVHDAAASVSSPAPHARQRRYFWGRPNAPVNQACSMPFDAPAAPPGQGLLAAGAGGAATPASRAALWRRQRRRPRRCQASPASRTPPVHPPAHLGLVSTVYLRQAAHVTPARGRRLLNLPCADSRCPGGWPRRCGACCSVSCSSPARGRLFWGGSATSRTAPASPGFSTGGRLNPVSSVPGTFSPDLRRLGPPGGRDRLPLTPCGWAGGFGGGGSGRRREASKSASALRALRAGLASCA